LAKEELWKLKYFTMPKYNLQKNPLKEIQNPSPYYKLIIFWQKRNYGNSNISPNDQLGDKHMDKQNKDRRLKPVCRPKIKLPLNLTCKIISTWTFRTMLMCSYACCRFRSLLISSSTLSFMLTQPTTVKASRLRT
jgi:hypothetical protein